MSALLTVAQVADELAVKPRTVLRRIRAGLLPAVRDGHLVRVRRADLDAYIEARRYAGVQRAPTRVAPVDWDAVLDEIAEDAVRKATAAV